MRLTHIATITAFGLTAMAVRSQAAEPSGSPASPLAVAQSMRLPEPSRTADIQLLPSPNPATRPSAGLALPDLEQMAMQNNPTLAQARARVQAARGEWLQSGLYPNPVVGYSGEEMGDDGTAGKQGGFVGQELVTAGKLGLNRAAASQEIVRLQQEFEAQQSRVLTDVRVAFYAVLVSQRRVELGETLQKIANEGVRAAEALLEAKEASRVDILQARVEANRASMLLQDARNEHQGAWRALAAVVGLPDMAVATLSGDVEVVGPALAWDDVVARLLSESPEVAAAAAEVDAARWTRQRAQVEWVPNVGVAARVQHDNATGDNIAGVDVSLPLPLFNRNQGNIVAADARLIAAQRNIERVRLSLQNRAAVVYRRYANAAQEVEKYRGTILPDAKETLELVTAGYQQGEFNYLSLLTVQRTYFQSTLSYLESLLQLKTARAEIDGLLLSGSLSNSFDEAGKP